MSIKFCELIFKYKNSENAFKLIYFLSKIVKNLDNYFEHREEKIDFPISEFEINVEKIEKLNFPIERITKQVLFKNQQFIVDENVFIPRDETEKLVDIFEKYVKKLNLKDFKYIDICSGTGAIGISIFLKNNSIIKDIFFLDISELAIKNIEKNLFLFSIKANVVCVDWFKYLSQNNFEVITANFPYVSKNDVFDNNILQYEPHLALFAKNNGWDNYIKLLFFCLSNKYWKLIICECNEFHEKKWQEIKKNKKYKDIEFQEFFDLNGKFRFIVLLNKISIS